MYCKYFEYKERYKYQKNSLPRKNSRYRKKISMNNCLSQKNIAAYKLIAINGSKRTLCTSEKNLHITLSKYKKKNCSPVKPRQNPKKGGAKIR